MKDLYIKYAYHIDELRQKANISLGDFCEGVCDTRTFRYYISGSRTMSQKALNGFCGKLGFTPKDFYSSFNRSDKEEYQEVANLYLDVSNGKLESAKKRLLNLDRKQFTNPQSEYLFDYSIIEYNFRSKAITKEHALDLFSKLINYPKCLNKNAFTMVEFVTLKSISSIEFLIKEYKAYNHLKDMLINPEVELVSAELRDTLPYLYGYISFMAGMKGDIEISKEMAKKGIKFSHRLQSMDGLDKMYYYYTLSCFMLGDDDWKEYLPKYLAMIIVKYDEQYLKEKIAMLERDGMKDPMSYLNIIKKV